MSGIPPFSGITPPGLGTVLTAGGWTRDAGPPAVTRLTTVTDQLGVGTALPLAGSKMEVLLDDAVNAGISDVTVLTHTVTGGVGLAGIGTGLLFRAEGTAATQDAGAVRARLTNVGVGTEASELGLYTRTAGGALTLRWRVDDTGVWVPDTDATYGIGNATNRAAAIYGTNFYALNTAGVGVQATYQMTAAAGFAAGPGLAVAADVALRRTGTLAWTVDNGGGGVVTLNVVGTTVTQARRIATAFGTATPYTMDSGATPDEFIGRDATAGNKVVTLVAAVTGREVTVKNTALLAVVNTVAATPNGVETIDGVAGALLLTGTQSVTLVGLTGTGWYVK